jgi:hypothetical protein
MGSDDGFTGRAGVRARKSKCKEMSRAQATPGLRGGALSRMGEESAEERAPVNGVAVAPAVVQAFRHLVTGGAGFWVVFCGGRACASGAEPVEVEGLLQTCETPATRALGSLQAALSSRRPRDVAHVRQRERQA